MSGIKNGPILAIDSATGPCSAAVWKDGRVAAYVENARPVMQSASLMPLVEEALKQSDVAYRQLSAVAATVGPGSFTGIRVGLAAARGIAFAADIPALGYTTLEVLAYAAKDRADHSILAILNAGKGEWYHQMFSPEGVAESGVRLTAIEQARSMKGPLVVAGNAALDFLPSAIAFPRADALARLAAERPEGAQAMLPFYIRDPDAKLPQKKM